MLSQAAYGCLLLADLVPYLLMLDLGPVHVLQTGLRQGVREEQVLLKRAEPSTPALLMSRGEREEEEWRTSP